MTAKEAKIRALVTMWGWATNHCEGIEKGELSDVLSEDVYAERYTESEAKKIQKQFYLESQRIKRRIAILRNSL